MIAEVLRRPVSVIVGTVAISAIGIVSLTRLPLAMLPVIERPTVTITAHAAASRDQMLREVTEPIERRLFSIRGVTSVVSETEDGLARIDVTAAWQSDADRLRIDIARRIEGAATISLDEMNVETRSSDALPVIEIAVSGSSAVARTEIARRLLVPELARVDGVGTIDVLGATPLRVVVEPGIAALTARGLTASDIATALSSVGASTAAGSVRQGVSTRPLLVAQPMASVEQLQRLEIVTPNGSVPLGEVAAISLREVGDGTSFRFADVKGGGDAVLLSVQRAPGANAVTVARQVAQRIEELRPQLRGVTLRVVEDRSREVVSALRDLAFAAIAGILLAALVLRFVLGDWRATMALVVVVPVALLASFTVFFAAGIPLDVISLAGLALATGLLVDNSIVVLESIETSRAAGERDPVEHGTRRIVVAVVASSITLVAVFAPLLYLRGLARAFFGEQAIAVVASVIASLFFALTLTPVLARKSVGSESRNPGLALYLRLLAGASSKRSLLVASSIAVVLLAGAALYLLPHELFARGTADTLVVEFRMPPQLDHQAATDLSERIWKSLRRAAPPERVRSMSMARYGTRRTDAVIIEAKSARGASELIEPLRRALRSLPEVSSRVTLRPSTVVEVAGTTNRTELLASSLSDSAAASLAERLRQAAAQRQLAPIEDRSGRQQLAMLVHWNEPRLAQNDISRETSEAQLRDALGERDLGRIDLSPADPSIRLLASTPRDPALLPVRAKSGVVPLAAVADLALGTRPPPTLHDGGRPARRLIYATRDTSWSTGSLQRGDVIRVAGEARELADAEAQMQLAALLAIALLYLTIAAFYESLVLPLLVMLILPFAAAGGVFALLITGQSLNLMALVGLIFLGGIVVNHAVVLIDRAEQLRREGVEEDIAVQRAAADRFRPVVMTTVTAILGMLPLALMAGEGVELRRPVASVVIGGLILGTLGTLLLLPQLHRMAEPLRRRQLRAEEKA